MKPKMYRKTKASKGSDMIKFKANQGGGRLPGIIIGPESSTGSTDGKHIAKPHAEQGNDRGPTE